MDPAYERERLPYLDESSPPATLAPARTRDNGELPYALASVRRNLPWVQYIFVVTNGQRPPTQVLEMPGVRWISHTDVFRRREHLPTFNSNAIEANLGFIPGLADKFIVISDDYLIGRRMEFEDFFAGPDRLPVLRRENQPMPARADPTDPYAQALSRTFSRIAREGIALGRRPLAHVPSSWTRATWETMWQRFELELAQTSAARFRQPTDMAVDVLHAGVCLSMYPRLLSLSPCSISRETYRFVRLGAPGHDWRGELASVLQDRPDFVCLNDEAGEEDEAEVQVALSMFLNDYCIL